MRRRQRVTNSTDSSIAAEVAAEGGASVVVESVSHSYRGVEVLHDVNLSVEPGEFVALVGPSGSGKSTLLHLMGSLDRPTRGRILVDGVNVGELHHPAKFRRSSVGFVFQLHYLLPALTVEQNVELPMTAAGVPARARRERALALLADVGLHGRDHSLPSELSGGERQRVALARALSNHPKLVLADEPTGSLDSVASEQVWRLLNELCRRDGTTVIVASHDHSIETYTDRVLQLVDGRLSERESDRAELR
jgi:putative ABC transport system ATP-binding protein